MAILKIKKTPINSFFEFANPETPAQLADIVNEAATKNSNQSDFLNSPGFFVYETKFFVNTKKALSLGVDSIEFKFYNTQPVAGSVPIEGGSFSIKVENPEEKSFFVGGKVGLASSLSVKPSKVSEALIFSKAQGFENIAKVSPLMSVTSIEQPTATAPFKAIAKNNQVLNKKDPASQLAAGKFLSNTPAAAISLGNDNSYPYPDDKSFEAICSFEIQKPISLKDSRNNLQKSRKGSQNTQILNSLVSLPKIVDPASLTKILPVLSVEIATHKEEYTRQLYFNKKNILGSEKIYVSVSAVVSKKFKNVVGRQTFQINHGSEVRDFFGNPEPPVVQSSESSFGRMSVILSKSDPSLNKVKVVRITSNPNALNPVIETRGTLVFENEKQIYYEDDVDNVAPNVVIYRFVVMNLDGSYGEFSSVVLNSFTKVADQKKVESATTPISIRALNDKNYVQILVDTLNDQVFSLRLLRQDMGAIGEFSDTVKTIYSQTNEYSTVVSGEKTTLEFLDYDAVPGRHYRYFAAYKIGQGIAASLQQESISDEDETIVRRQVTSDLPFKASLTAPVTLQDQTNSISVSFEMSVQEVDETFNVLVEALTLAGVSSQFLQDLQNDRQKARQVAVFLVERVDRVTGKRATFGVYPPGSFADSPEERTKRGVPAPIPGRKYEYVCKLCIRPPESFLLTAFTGFVARSSSAGNVTQVLAAKFQSAFSSFGIIPSQKDVRNGYSIKENFVLGQTGLELSNTVKMPLSGPQIKNLEVKSRKFYDLLSWSVIGDTSQVSYFLVYCNYNGIDELVGTVSAIGKNASYKYKDDRYSQEVGEKKYFVKIVTADHDISLQSTHVETITNFSLPAPVLDGYIISPSKNEVAGVVLPGPGPAKRSSLLPKTPNFANFASLVGAASNFANFDSLTRAANAGNLASFSEEKRGSGENYTPLLKLSDLPGLMWGTTVGNPSSVSSGLDGSKNVEMSDANSGGFTSPLVALMNVYSKSPNVQNKSDFSKPFLLGGG